MYKVKTWRENHNFYLTENFNNNLWGMSTAVNTFLIDYASRLPAQSKLALSPRTLECEGRRTLLLNHVVDVSSNQQKGEIILIPCMLCFQRPTARMDLFQICVNEENRLTAKGRRNDAKNRRPTYYNITKTHVSSTALLRRQTQEQLVDARIVEKIRCFKEKWFVIQITSISVNWATLPCILRSMYVCDVWCVCVMYDVCVFVNPLAGHCCYSNSLINNQWCNLGFKRRLKIACLIKF